MTKEELIKLSRENLRKSKQGSLCECYDEAYIKGYELSEKQIAELEKENAELKKDNSEWEKASDKWKSVYELTNKQLTNVKEIIREFVEWATWQGSNCPNFKSIQDKAEQFLKGFGKVK